MIGPVHETGIDRPLIERVVRDFYAAIRNDALLGPVFASHVVDWVHHEARIADFWTSVMLLTGQYKGTPLQAHLALPDLTEQHFQQWLALFHQSLARCCNESQAAQFEQRAHRIARSFQMAREQQRGVIPFPIAR